MATVPSRTRLIDDLFTTTWDEVSRDVIDQVLQITPFWSMMVEKGRIREKMPDGNYFYIPISYAKQDQNIAWFGRGKKFGRAEKEHLTQYECEARNLGTSVVRFWEDDRKNRNKAKLIDYVNEKIDGTKSALTDQLETDTFTQNSSGDSMNALPTLISTTPTTGTVQGLNRANQEYMANQTSNFSGLTAEDDLLNYMRTLFNDCSKYKGGSRRTPDVILTTQSVYEKYEEICENLRMIVANTSVQASLGYGNLAFKGVPIFWAPECTAGYLYMLNTEHIWMAVDPSAYFDMTEWKSDPDTLDRVCQIVCVCQLCVDNFKKQGIMYNISTS